MPATWSRAVTRPVLSGPLSGDTVALLGSRSSFGGMGGVLLEPGSLPVSSFIHSLIHSHSHRRTGQRWGPERQPPWPAAPGALPVGRQIRAAWPREAQGLQREAMLVRRDGQARGPSAVAPVSMHGGHSRPWPWSCIWSHPGLGWGTSTQRGPRDLVHSPWGPGSPHSLLNLGPAAPHSGHGPKWPPTTVTISVLQLPTVAQWTMGWVLPSGSL